MPDTRDAATGDQIASPIPVSGEIPAAVREEERAIGRGQEREAVARFLDGRGLAGIARAIRAGTHVTGRPPAKRGRR